MSTVHKTSKTTGFAPASIAVEWFRLWGGQCLPQIWVHSGQTLSQGAFEGRWKLCQTRSYPRELECLIQRFPNLAAHQNYLGSFLKMGPQPHPLILWFRRPGQHSPSPAFLTVTLGDSHEMTLWSSSSLLGCKLWETNMPVGGCNLVPSAQPPIPCKYSGRQPFTKGPLCAWRFAKWFQVPLP